MSDRERKTLRLKSWDYSWSGIYFVTICTNNRNKYFGDIRNKIMCISDLGMISSKCFIEIPKHFPAAQIDNFIIMPNHIHGLIKITQIDRKDPCIPQTSRGRRSASPTTTPNSSDPTKMTLSKIIHGFKSSVTRIFRDNDLLGEAAKHHPVGDADLSVRQAGLRPLQQHHSIWQRSYYDRIVRNEKEYWKIYQYIQQNVINWESDINNISKA